MRPEETAIYSLAQPGTLQILPRTSLERKLVVTHMNLDVASILYNDVRQPPDLDNLRVFYCSHIGRGVLCDVIPSNSASCLDRTSQLSAKVR